MITLLHILKYPMGALISILMSLATIQRFGDYWGGVALVLTFIIIIKMFNTEIKDLRGE
jgi:hypothetical protein